MPVSLIGKGYKKFSFKCELSTYCNVYREYN